MQLLFYLRYMQNEDRVPLGDLNVYKEKWTVILRYCVFKNKTRFNCNGIISSRTTATLSSCSNIRLTWSSHLKIRSLQLMWQMHETNVNCCGYCQRENYLRCWLAESFGCFGVCFLSRPLIRVSCGGRVWQRWRKENEASSLQLEFSIIGEATLEKELGKGTFWIAWKAGCLILYW